MGDWRGWYSFMDIITQLKNSEIIDAVIKLNACYKNIKNKKNYIFLQGRSFVLDGGVLMGDPRLCP